MGITRPTGEQLRFRSQNTGDHVLDTYLEASEKGGRALTDLLDDLFDSSGVFRAANFEFQFDPSVDKIQFRAGNFANPSAGWTDITTFFNITGTFNAATTYQNFDLATTSDKDVYIVHGLSSGTTFANEAAFIASSNTTRIVDVSEARDWAKKTDGIVSSTDYSSKAWAIGGTGVTNSATGGAAKEWAIKTSGTVDGTNYSAKYWATSTDVVTVSTNIADVTTVATDISNVNTVSTNISSVNTTSSNIADVNTVAAEIGVGQDVTVVAADLSGTDTIGTAATNIANINTTAGSIANVNTVATDISNVNTVSGSIANVNTVAPYVGSGNDITVVAAQITNNNLQTIAADIAAVITTANDLNEAVSEIDTVANAIANVDTVGANIASVNTVSTNIANVNTVGTDISNVNTVATNLGAGNDVTVVAANIADVNTVAGISADVTTAATNSVQFNNTYLGAQATAPTLDPDGSALDLGDLYFDTTTNTMKVYSSSGWINAGSSVNGTADRFTYTATASQTTFTGADDNTNSLSYDAGFIDVYMNGVKLVNGSDFTATNGTSIVLTSGAAANDTIEIIAYGTFTLSNQSINDMTDVSTSGVADNNLLAYNSANSQFEPIQDPDVRFVTAEQINLRSPVNTGKVLVLDVEQGDVIGVGDLEIYDDRTTGNGYIKRGDTSVQTIAADTVSITDHTAQNQRAYFNASGLTVSGTISGTFSGNLTGDTIGTHTGAVNATDVTVTGVVTGNVTGDVLGDVKANNGAVILDSGTNGTDAAYTGSVTGEVDLSALAATISDTAVDIFVYDTRKDSDGGAWRKRTQGTSWYNETLNTTTRGSRKEFPAVAVIVAESSQVTIYDGDDPDLPMWMVFNQGTNYAIGGNTSTLSCVAMLNGILFVGRASNGFKSIYFVNDTHFFGNNSTGYFTYPNTISRRNNDDGYIQLSGSGYLVADPVNDVAMTVLPNAPIDAATGLPVPTIAVATEGGISVIRDDGSVVDATSTGPDGSKADRISFSKTNQIVVGTKTTYDARYDEVGILDNIPSADRSSYQWGWDRSYNYTWSNAQPVPSLGLANSQYDYQKNALATSENTLAVDHPNGLTLVDDSTPVRTNNMVHYITPTYATGWMNGAIKLATLSDTDDTDVVGSELVTNGTFDSNTSGWTEYSGATLSLDAGRLKVTENSGDGQYGIYQTLTTEAGKKYVITFDIELGTTGTTTFFIGDTDWGGSNKTISADGTYSYTVTTNDTSSILYIHTLNANSGSYFLVDNISVRLAEEDRSVNGNGLQVFGTVTKNPVATGADLVAYSGFSTSNYLEQPYNSDLDFGTGDFCIMGWFKSGYDNGNYQWLLERQAGQLEVFAFSGTGILRVYVGGNAIETGQSVNTGTWNNVCYVRRNGVGYMYLNGILKNTTTMANTVNTNNSSPLRLGARNTGTLYPTTGSLALWRISATAPSPEQIKKIYEDEKVLFQENAQATLYGSSDAVTALAYDDSTNLLHVGTSAGRSVFQGLRRVDNTTTAVGAAISASNGLVADE
jgi:hypothetical protein